MNTATIYATVIRRLYLHDDTFGGTFKAQTLYIHTKTDSKAGNPHAQPTKSHELSPAIQAEITHALNDVPVTIVWIATLDMALHDPTGAIANHGAVISVGSIDQQPDQSVQVAGSVYVAPEGAGGRTYVLEQSRDGIWHIKGTTGVEWVS